MNKFPYAGQQFTITMDNGLKVINHYLDDGKTIAIEILSGELKGVKMQVPFKWTKISDDDYLVSWQESDNSTVVHCDNFTKKKSHSFYTTMKGEFFVMEGIIS